MRRHGVGETVLRVTLLGSFGVSVDMQPVHTDLGPSGQRMAAYLFAFPGRRHRRERLADLFWPELSFERSRAALNSALWRLRRLLSVEPESSAGGNLRTVGSYVVFESPPWLEVDVHRLDSLLQEMRNRDAPLVDTSRRRALQEAVDLYHGPFLEQAEEQVFIEERERIHTNFVSLADILVQSHAAARADDEAMKVCRRVLGFDPFRERFIRYLLALFVLSEQRAEAIRFYETWRKSLREEMCVNPMPGTVDMMRMIREFGDHGQIDDIRSLVFHGRERTLAPEWLCAE